MCQFANLFVQFSSLRDTLLIFGLLPLSCVGGVAALEMMGLHFSVPAAIGFLALFGITVMEGIILLSHFHALKDAGMPWRQAQLGHRFLESCFGQRLVEAPPALSTTDDGSRLRGGQLAAVSRMFGGRAMPAALNSGPTVPVVGVRSLIR